MQRFILSAFSVLLATVAVAPAAQALPKIDANFDIQTLRLSEFDARNKSSELQQPYYYPETSTQPSPQSVSAEDASIPNAESAEPTTVWESPASQEKDASPVPSLTEQRHQVLDRS